MFLFVDVVCFGSCGSCFLLFPFLFNLVLPCVGLVCVFYFYDLLCIALRLCFVVHCLVLFCVALVDLWSICYSLFPLFDSCCGLAWFVFLVFVFLVLLCFVLSCAFCFFC